MAGRKGFTLIELLVVIAIIALLMSILAPALTRVMEQAKNALCLARLHQWAAIYAMYADDNDGRLTGWHKVGPGDKTYCPPGIVPGSASPTWPEPPSHEQCWVPRLRRYYAEEMKWEQVGGNWVCNAKNWDFCMCPATDKTWEDGEFRGPMTGWSFKWLHDMVSASWYYYMDSSYGSYGKNSWVTDSQEVDKYWPGSEVPGGGTWNTTRVRETGRIPLFTDNSFPAQHIMEYYAIPEERYRYVFDGEFRPCQDRHNLTINIAFLDFTVRKVGLKQLWQLYWHRNWDMTAGIPDPRDLEIWPSWLRNAPMIELGY